MKNFLICGKMAGIVAVSIFIGAILILAVYSLPTTRIFHNLERSIKIYEQEGNYPYWAGGVTHTRIDNVTDAIMLMKAAYPVENLIDSAFLNPSWQFTKALPADTLVDVVTNKIGATSDNWTYARYWHGYLVILKPALMIAPVHELRVLNFYVQFFLIATALNLIYRRMGLREMYAFLLILAMINPITTAINFQLADIFYIMLLATIFILCKNDFLLRGENYLYFFLIIGIVTAYVDFLTYPIVGFGIPLCFCVLMNKKFFFNSEPKEVLKKLLSYSFAWGFGYLGMWLGKWILATIFTNQNVIADALSQGSYRTSTILNEAEGNAAITFTEILSKIFEALSRGPLPIILIVLIIFLLYLIIVKKRKFSATPSMLLTFAFIILLPFLWYAVFKNHSYVHDFMAYRDLAITIFGLICFFMESLKERKYF